MMNLLKRLMMPVLAFGIGSGLAGCENDPNFPSEQKAYKKKDGQHIITEQGVFFSDRALDWLEKKMVPRDSSQAYDSHLKLSNPEEIPKFYSEGLTPGAYNQYDQRFREDLTVAELFYHNIMPDIANKFDERFNLGDIIAFNERGFTPEVVNAFHKEFQSNEVFSFLNQGVDSELVNQYCTDDNLDLYGQRWRGDVILKFIQAGLTPEVARAYGGLSMQAEERIILHENKISPERFSEYSDFASNVLDVITLEESKIPIELSRRFYGLNQMYGTSINSEDIVRYVDLGISYDTVAKRAKEYMVRESLEN
ncbi:hypothetical protein HYT56_02805 [Candidatus Woesearchaeota archaeon]|nr:hypothetical protein [Candidatus Woesearchaeota archaeon]